ncbi:MAG: DNA polymerase III subunit beta [Sulfurihydrogenibium sp.]|jgi:DNA polymerase-3 subunit beta|uniref:DNA polymerase III subunit beta n=1 Tax=Sulfurihydrogenibium sp. TaxID=2053621 RepID=UPI000CC02263|nr:MAG: DNA polymerase III subunit beta [Sulfurihydrogenibium sp.]
MKITVDRKIFQEAVKKVIAEKKAALPILTNFLLKAENGRLVIQGTDLEVFTTYWINADVEEEGAVCVNAKKLTDISKVLPSTEVSLSLEKSNLKIVSGKTKYSIPTVDPNDFPTFESFPSDLAVSISGSTLLNGITKTVYAASKDESRFALNGVCFSFVDSHIDFVATDGHRLALYKGEITGKGVEGKHIVPQKALSEVKKLVSEYEDVEIAISGSSIFFKGGDWMLSARLLEGIFPDYTQVIPTTFNIQVEVSKNEIIDSVKRVVVAEESDAKPIKLTLKENKLIVSTPTSEDTFAEDEIDIDYEGEEFEIGFNGKYIIEAIDEIEDSRVLMKFINKDSQTVIVPKDENEPYLAVVMPMSI